MNDHQERAQRNIAALAGAAARAQGKGGIQCSWRRTSENFDRRSYTFTVASQGESFAQEFSDRDVEDLSNPGVALKVYVLVRGLVAQLPPPPSARNNER